MTRKLMQAIICACSTFATGALSGGAFAADLPLHSAPVAYVPPPALFTWTGFYIGGQIGYEWGTSSTTSINNATGVLIGQPDYHPGGIVGGFHTGYNYQISNLVIGYESATNFSSYKGEGVNYSGTISHFTNMPTESSIRGRVGYAWDRTLLFLAGGVAFGRLQNTSTNIINGAFDTSEDYHVGWTVGGGVEYALTEHWSVRAEYRYTDYGNINEYEAYSTGGAYSINKHETDQRVQVGFSYKFEKPLFKMAADMLRRN